MCVRRSRLLRVSLAHGFALALFGLVSGPPGVARAQVPTEVAVYEDGQTTRRVRAAEAGREGLTLLDLRDDWAPRPFAASDGHTDGPSYRAPFVALANGQLGSGPEAVRPLYDRHLELHGIPPALTLLRARLEDTERHRCRDAVDDTALQAMTGVQRPFEDVGRQRARRAENELLGARLERERVRTGAPTLEALAADARYTKPVRRYLAERIRFDAVRAVQAHLRCERTLDGPADGLYAGVTQYALGLFQREHMLPSKGLLDEDTRAALLADSRELDFRAVLRVLRERTADAAALIEDGSAAGATDDGAQSVLGRHLEVSRMRADASRGPLPNAAPDLIGPATEAAARALGLTSPEAATRALPALMTAGVVAVKLPPPPPWHTPPMSLRAEIDRGDVYTAWPYGPDGKRKTWDVERRPVLTLYARGGDGGPERALIRWPTTIGGWQRERLKSGAIGRKYKESPVGPRVWRRLVVAPAWLPPPTTPPQELVREQPDGWVIDTETMGPGYASAYGLVMLVNEQEQRRRNGPPVYADQGVRVHGSVSYASIGRGESHGCHRLFNHLALRLGGFILAHHAHERTGTLPARYALRFRYRGMAFERVFTERGYEYLLDPPVPVEVLPGRVFRSLPRGAR
jgi:hypothetical protein